MYQECREHAICAKSGTGGRHTTNQMKWKLNLKKIRCGGYAPRSPCKKKPYHMRGIFGTPFSQSFSTFSTIKVKVSALHTLVPTGSSQGVSEKETPGVCVCLCVCVCTCWSVGGEARVRGLLLLYLQSYVLPHLMTAFYRRRQQQRRTCKLPTPTYLPLWLSTSPRHENCCCCCCLEGRTVCYRYATRCC